MLWSHGNVEWCWISVRGFEWCGRNQKPKLLNIYKCCFVTMRVLGCLTSEDLLVLLTPAQLAQLLNNYGTGLSVLLSITFFFQKTAERFHRFPVLHFNLCKQSHQRPKYSIIYLPLADIFDSFFTNSEFFFFFFCLSTNILRLP